ncbi:hypothetical protein [Aerococcus urinaeequi]
MYAQKTKFRDNTFNAVVTTFVFCSVSNPVEKLEEI